MPRFSSLASFLEFFQKFYVVRFLLQFQKYCLDGYFMHISLIICSIVYDSCYVKNNLKFINKFGEQIVTSMQSPLKNLPKNVREIHVSRLNGGSIEDDSEAPRYHSTFMFERYQGGLQMPPMMPRDANLSDSCTMPDRCCFFQSFMQLLVCLYGRRS